MAYLSFTRIQAAERGAVVIAGSFAPEVDSGGGNGPSSDGYDAYGLGYTAERKETGVVDVVLSRRPSRVLCALGGIESTASKDMFVQVEHPCPRADGDGDTVRFRMLSGTTLTDLAHNDRLHFFIVADYSSV
jgi:hypothetical protein